MRGADAALQLAVVVLGVAVVLLLVLAVGNSDVISGMRSEAIKRGYALYCPTDGEWRWTGECDE